LIPQRREGRRQEGRLTNLVIKKREDDGKKVSWLRFISRICPFKIIFNFPVTLSFYPASIMPSRSIPELDME
jgi:hypothetical protein